MQAQKTTRLCIVRDLTEHDIVSRIMRKDNYLIGMLNRGVLALHISLPGVRPRFMLTKTLEWNLQWCILDAMFDDSFRIRPDFVNNPQAIEQRFRYVLAHTIRLVVIRAWPQALHCFDCCIWWFSVLWALHMYVPSAYNAQANWLWRAWQRCSHLRTIKVRISMFDLASGSTVGAEAMLDETLRDSQASAGGWPL